MKNGFTVIEIVTVIILLGVLTTVVVSAAPGDESELQSQIASIRAHYRYARMKALSTGDVWGVNSNGNSYVVYEVEDDGTTTNWTVPGETSAVISLAGTPASPMSSINIRFDAFGEPFVVTGGGTGRLAAVQDISVGGEGAAIQIHPLTGFIP